MNLSEAFTFQARACADLGSPFMERLCTLAADRLDRSTEVGRVLWDWPGDIGPFGTSLPLRWAGGLHALKLMGDTSLASVYPPRAVSDDALWKTVQMATDGYTMFLLDWLQSPPQTNEVRRSGAIIPAASVVARTFGLPLSVMELGASAGLNLCFDHFSLETQGWTLAPDAPVLSLSPDWRGDAPGPLPARVAARAGVDLMPIDPGRDDMRLRLLAYLWPDQPDRMARTEAAISVARTTVDQGDAADWLKAHLSPTPGQTTFIYHTIAWQYFPQDTQARATEIIETAGRAATPDTPVAWFGMEADGKDPGAGLTLRLWPGDQSFDLGRADFHGRWIDWREPASLAP